MANPKSCLETKCSRRINRISKYISSKQLEKFKFVVKSKAAKWYKTECCLPSGSGYLHRQSAAFYIFRNHQYSTERARYQKWLKERRTQADRKGIGIGETACSRWKEKAEWEETQSREPSQDKSAESRQAEQETEENVYSLCANPSHL